MSSLGERLTVSSGKVVAVLIKDNKITFKVCRVIAVVVCGLDLTQRNNGRDSVYGMVIKGATQ